MKVNRILLLVSVVCSLSALSVPLYGQKTDWDRFIADGDSASGQKQYPQAEDSYRRALQFAEAHWRKDARLSATSIKLAEACEANGKKDEAEDFAHRAVAQLFEAMKAHKPKDASEEMMQADVSATLLTKAGDLFSANEKFTDAEDVYQRAIVVRANYASEKKPLKPTNEDFFRFMAQNLSNSQAKVADARDKLGALYRRQQKFQQAEEQFQQSRAIREKVFGADQPPVAQSLTDLAMCYAMQGQYQQAMPLYKNVVTILENSKLQESPEMVVALENYALVLRKTGHATEAQPYIDRVRAIRSRSQGVLDTPK